MGEKQSIKSTISSKETLPKEILQKRVLDHRRLVAYTVRRIENQIPVLMTKEDALQYGMIGLMMAGDRFDEEKGKFSPLAFSVVKAQVMEGIGDFLPLSRSQARDVRKWKHWRELRKNECPEISETMLAHQICKDMGIPPEKEKSLRLLSEMCIIDQDQLEKENSYFEKCRWEYEKQSEQILLKTDVNAAVEKLTKDQKSIIRGCFFENKPSRTIMKEMGISQRKYRKEYERAIRKLRRELSGYGE